MRGPLSTTRAARWLLTGGSGLIGRSIAARLHAEGVPLRLLEHTTALATDMCEVVRGDILDRASLDRALDGIDGVVHAAACLVGGAQDFERVNAVGTQHLAEAAARVGVRRFVFVGTAAVYAPGPLDDVDEDWPVEPHDVYSHSKLEAERRARAVLGERLVVVRLPSVFGPGRTRFLEHLAGAVLHHDLPAVPGGGARIELVHADDVADAVLELVRGRGTSPVYNLSGPVRVSCAELAEAVAIELGCTPRWVPLDPAAPEGFEPDLLAISTVERTISDARARRDLCYRPSRDWRASMRAAAAELR